MNGARNGIMGGIIIVIGTILLGEPLASTSSRFLDALDGLPRFFLLGDFVVIFACFFRWRVLYSGLCSYPVSDVGTVHGKSSN